MQVNGVNETVGGIDTVSGTWTLAAGESRVAVFTPAAPLAPGDLWTVSLMVAGNPMPLGWGGRVIPEHFPIETWPHGGDCRLLLLLLLLLLHPHGIR